MKRNISAALAAMVLVTGMLTPSLGGTVSAEEALQAKQINEAASTSSVVSAKAEPTAALKAFTDVGQDHWAAQSVLRWSGSGIVTGYGDGSFRPNKEVTKAEFAAIINRIFNYQQQADTTPSDVGAASWFKADIAKGLAAGYLSVDQKNNIHPSLPITRAEVALALQQVFQLGAGNTAASFKDLNGQSPETSKAITALSAAGYIQGYPGGLFKPQGAITRAELARMADRMVTGLVVSSGEASLGTVAGNVVINRADVVLKNTVIKGNLYLSEGIGEGNARLEGVKVTGTTFVRGGGEQGVGFLDSEIGEIRVDKANGKLRIYTSGSTSTGTVHLQSGATLEESSLTGAGFADVEIDSGPKTVALKGKFESVSTADSADKGVALNISGAVGKLTLRSPSQVVLADNAKVASLILTTNAKGTVIQGSGSIATLDNQADGVTIGGVAAVKGNSGQVTLPLPAKSTPPTGGTSGSIPTTDPWTLVWNDEFNDETIDATKWTYDLGDGTAVNNPGWGNNELQWYTNEEKNVKEQDGKLIITARKEQQGGKEYTSSRIKTKGLFSKKYGKFEIKAKAPAGKGYWPAIWMLPEKTVYGAWASSGEIDIMESWGSRPGTVAGTIHYGAQWPDNVYSGKEYNLPNQSTIEQFHTYAMEWEPGEIRWYVDGQLYSTKNDWYSLSNGQPMNNAYPAPFNQEFHLLMNLAVGGNFDGNPTPETVFPKTMEIDYVRVYELTGREYREPAPITLVKEPYLEGSKLALPDGNLVYNNNFSEQAEGDAGMGIPNTAHWALFKEQGVDAAVSIEPIGERNFAKMSITNAGGNAYSVQPQAIVSLAKGRFYKLSFDAKTDTSRNINVKLTGGQSRGFAAYSMGLKAELTSAMTHYEMKFQMKENSDIAARIEFNMGTNASPVWFGNVRLEEIDSIPFEHDSAKTPLGSGNHLYNGTFDLGEPNRLTYWHVEAASGAAVSPKVDDEGQLKLQITNGGSGANDVKLLQKGIFLIQGHDYELTFDASTSSARTATVQLLGKNGSVYAEQAVNLSESNQKIKLNFNDLAGATDHEGQFVLQLGSAAGTVQLDNFQLLRTSFYYDPSLVYYPLKNGDFSFGFAGWKQLFIENGQGNAAVEDGAAKMSISNTGNLRHSIMLLQENMKLSRGQTYVVEFDASSTVARKIEVSVENSTFQPSFTNLVDLTPETKHFSFKFPQVNNDTMGLKFMLGKVGGVSIAEAHDVVIDNVKLEILNAPAKPQDLLSDSSNNRVSQPIEITFVDNADWRSKIQVVKVNGTALDAGQYTIEPGKIIIAPSAFPEKGIYTISVEADRYVSGSVEQTILANDKNLVINGSFESGTSGWGTWSGEGGASEFNVNDGVAEILISPTGTQTWATQLYQEEIKLEGGKTYELSFKAKSTVPRQIIVEYTGTSAQPKPANFDISATWATYSAQFTVANSNPLKLNYLIGKTLGADGTANTTPHTISFDDIVVKEVDGSTPVTPPSGTLDNGTFEEGKGEKGWSKYFDGTGSAEARGGEFAIDLTGTGNASYTAQVDYENLKLVQGKKYKVTFEARSTVDRKIEVAVEHKGAPYTKYLGPEKIDLTHQMKEFSYEFTMTGATDVGAHLVFLMGLIDGNSPETNSAIPGSSIYLDNVRLEEVI